MANGLLQKEAPTNVQYTKYKYTYGGTTYTGIHTFLTLAGTQTITPAIAVTRTTLANINPVTAAAENVIAKTNACMHRYGFPNEFYGFFYQGAGHAMYVDGTAYSSTSGIPSTSVLYKDKKYYPSFCVKKDGTATIRWFTSKASLDTALNYCQCVIGSVHPLVYNSKCVLNQTVVDSVDGITICNPSNLNAENTHFAGNIGNPDEKERRTLLGHISGSSGRYIMVCTDSKMTVKVAANMMQDLGCDYAVNMDGGLPSQMRIKNGYDYSGQVNSAIVEPG